MPDSFPVEPTAFARVFDCVSDVIGERPSITRSKYEYETSPGAEDLADAGVISDTAIEMNRVIVWRDRREIARSDYIVCKNDPVAYMKQIEVIEQYRGNGIGTALHACVADQLAGFVDSVYSYPTSETMRVILEKDSFEPVTDGNGLDGWFVR